MKVIFFNPTVKPFFKPMTSPLGVLSLASYLNANGHDASIFDRYYRKENIAEFLDREKPDIIGISVITNRFMIDALDISKLAKKRSITVIWGGPMATQIPEVILENENIDYVSLGEGEITWLEIANAFDAGKPFDDIQSLAYMKNGEFVRTPERPFTDLTELPPLDWSLVDPTKYFQPYYGCRKMIYLYASKGCVGNCTFCYNAQYHHSKHRSRSYTQLVDEIEMLADKYGMDGINFADDLMFCNTSQIEEFCNLLIERNINVVWGGNLRVGIAKKPETYELMHKAGCRWILFGVETGSKHIQSVISKRIPFGMIEETFRMSSNAKIISIAPFMVGLPEETEEDLRETVALAKRLCSTFCVFNYFTPIPGTVVYDKLVAEGKYTPPKNLKGYSKMFFAEHLIFNSSEVPNRDLRAVFRFFQLRMLLFRDEFNVKGESNLFKKIFVNAMKSISSHGFINFIQSGFFGFFTFVDMFLFYLHPKLRKKYDLYFK
jgi:radical SAM superfamily enzyme YgiQ (UPF0313 family)